MTQINFKPIFPSPLGYVNFGNANKELNKQLIEDMETEMLEHEGKQKTFKKNTCSWQSLEGQETLYNSFEILRQKIDDVIKPILSHSGVSDNITPFIETCNLWGNIILDAGGYSRPHNHGSGNTLWGGVYYPKGITEEEDLDNFDETKHILNGYGKGDGLLIMFDPSHGYKNQVETKLNSQEFYGGEVSVVPRESLLILFPAWLIHMVTPLTKKEKRYSISFDVNKPQM